MIDKSVYEIDYIRELQKKYSADPGLIERALYAFGLLEAIKSVGIDERLKASNQMFWVRMMKNIWISVEEIVLKELIYL